MVASIILGLGYMDLISLVSALTVSLGQKVLSISRGDSVALTTEEELVIMDKIASQIQTFESSTAMDLSKGLSFTIKDRYANTGQMELLKMYDKVQQLMNAPDPESCGQLRNRIILATRLHEQLSLIDTNGPQSHQEISGIERHLKDLRRKYIQMRCGNGQETTKNPTRDQIAKLNKMGYRFEYHGDPSNVQPITFSEIMESESVKEMHVDHIMKMVYIF